MKTKEIIAKVEQSIVLITPALIGVGAVWGWDAAFIVGFIESIVLSILGWVEVYIDHKENAALDND